MKKSNFTATLAALLSVAGVAVAQNGLDVNGAADAAAVNSSPQQQKIPVAVVPKTAVPLPGAVAPSSSSGNKTALPLPTKKMHQHLSIEDQERLFSLYEENPVAYFDELRKVTTELRKRDQELNSKVMLAVAQYYKADKAEEKQKYLAEITAITRQQFSNRSEEIEHRLKEADKRLRELHKIHDFRKKNAEEIIARRISDLTREPGLKW